MAKTQLVKRTLDTEALQQGGMNLIEAIASVVKMSKDEKSMEKALKDEKSKQVLVKTVTTFSNFDLKFQGGMKGIGEFCYRVRSMDEKIQRELIGAICEQNGLEPTESTGRTGLAYAMFGKDKSMLRPEGNNKDSRAAMRITSYESAYKRSVKVDHGGKQGPKSDEDKDSDTGKEQSKTPRSAKALFVALMEQATEKEQLTLLRLARKADMDIPNEWLGSDEDEAEEKE